MQVVGPISSTYRWNGAIERADEFMCFVKTRRDLAEEVGAAIRALHAYENPEIVVLAIAGGSSDYLTWIESETASDQERHRTT